MTQPTTKPLLCLNRGGIKCTVMSFKFKVPKELAARLKTFSNEPVKVNFYMVDNENKIICKGIKGKKLIPLTGTITDISPVKRTEPYKPLKHKFSVTFKPVKK